MTVELPAAQFSSDRRYRYLLTRQVGFGDKRVLFVMLNPSTADEEKNDPTIRRCIGFANGWGYGWLDVTNLSPLRATDPKQLLAAGPEPWDVWNRNLYHIMAAAGSSDLVVAAYGNHGQTEDRAQKILTAFRDVGQGVHCLGLTKAGHPRHPLYVPAKTLPVPYCYGGKAL